MANVPRRPRVVSSVLYLICDRKPNGPCVAVRAVAPRPALSPAHISARGRAKAVTAEKVSPAKRQATQRLRAPHTTPDNPTTAEAVTVRRGSDSARGGTARSACGSGDGEMCWAFSFC